LDIFHDLNPLIGPGDIDGSNPTSTSAPYLDSVRRNVTGICDEPEQMERYEKIARTIKSNANMPGVLMAIQLIPHGVICMVYPLVNTEDFPPESGIVMDSRPTIGLDLVTLKADKEFVKRAMQLRQNNGGMGQPQAQQQQGQQSQVVIQGPIVLEECNQETIAGDCVPAVRQAFLARMAVRVPGYRTEIDGTVYEDTWGVAAVMLNWEELVKRSGMYETFQAQGYGFQLTRTDLILNGKTKEETKEVCVGVCVRFCLFYFFHSLSHTHCRFHHAYAHAHTPSLGGGFGRNVQISNSNCGKA
jgi:hypothetical protein